jgi:hypothetical protein
VININITCILPKLEGNYKLVSSVLLDDEVQDFTWYVNGFDDFLTISVRFDSLVSLCGMNNLSFWGIRRHSDFTSDLSVHLDGESHSIFYQMLLVELRPAVVVNGCTVAELEP